MEIRKCLLLIASLMFLNVTLAAKDPGSEFEESVIRPHQTIILGHEKDEFCIVSKGEAERIKIAEHKKAEAARLEALRVKAYQEAQAKKQIKDTEVAIEFAKDVKGEEIEPLSTNHAKVLPGVKKLSPKITDKTVISKIKVSKATRKRSLSMEKSLTALKEIKYLNKASTKETIKSASKKTSKEKTLLTDKEKNKDRLNVVSKSKAKGLSQNEKKYT